MAYPPNTLPTNATDGASASDTTPTAVLTAAEVNATNAAVNDIVAELGSNPSGTDATVAARLDGIESDITSLGSGSIPDGSVSTAKLADGAVTAAKVAADVATQAELDAAIAGLSGTYARKVADWATGVAYAVGELVSSGGTLYRCTVAHTSSGSFAAGNFSAVSGGVGAVSSVVGQTGAVTGTQIVADATVAAALAGKAPLASPALTGTPTVPTAAADTNTTQAASTAFVLGQAGSATPVVNGTAAAGTSPRLARQDHVHPTDTSRAAATHVHAAGDITSGTVAAARLGAGTASASTFLRGDGQWAAPAGGGATAPTDRGAWATATSYAVRDVVTEAGVRYECASAHTSGTFSTDLAASRWVALDTGTAVPLAQSGQTPSQAPVALGTVSVGSLAYAARADHVHPAAGEHAWFGDGSDGDITLDGTNTYSSRMSKSGNVYTLTDVLMARNLTISAGVTLVMAAGLLHVSGTLTNSGTISSVGGNASGATAGAAAVFTAGTLNIAGAGAAGGTGVGAASLPPRTATNANPGSSQAFGGLAGAGGSGVSGAGGAQSSLDYQHNFAAKNAVRMPFLAFSGILPASATAGFLAHFGAAGGAAGAGDGTNSGGGGGGGGGCIVINARAIVNNGTVTANGGNGGTPSTGNCGGGGGGGGGPVFINTGSAVTGSGTVTNAGGSAGTGVGSGLAGAAGQAGHQQIIVWP